MKRYIVRNNFNVFCTETEKGDVAMEPIEVGEIFTISDENGEDQEVEVLGSLDIDGSSYVAVAFAEDIQVDSEDEIDVFFLKVDEDGDFMAIESDEEFEKVSSAFDHIFEEQE